MTATDLQPTARPERGAVVFQPRCYPCGAMGLELAHIRVHGHDWAICRSCADRYEFFPPEVHRRLQGAFHRREVLA